MQQSSGGSKASRHGRTAEHIIYAILQQYPLVIQRQMFVGLGIFGTNIYADFYVSDHILFPNGLIIESKWQDVSGSVDEKLPYLVHNIQYCYPCKTIIVIHGGGFRQGAIHWLKRQVDSKLIYVFALEEFLSWCNRNL